MSGGLVGAARGSTGWELVRPERRVWWRLGLAVLAGVLRRGRRSALLATSAWLITTAAAQPPVLTLMVAIVAVRAFGVGRGVFRYVERLAGPRCGVPGAGRDAGSDHRAAGAAGAWSGWRSQRSGDLLARLVLDIDAVLDLWLRVLLPVAGCDGDALLRPSALLAAAAAGGRCCCGGGGADRLHGGAVADCGDALRGPERRMAGERGEVAAAATETLLTAGRRRRVQRGGRRAGGVQRGGRAAGGS